MKIREDCWVWELEICGWRGLQTRHVDEIEERMSNTWQVISHRGKKKSDIRQTEDKEYQAKGYKS